MKITAAILMGAGLAGLGWAATLFAADVPSLTVLAQAAEGGGGDGGLTLSDLAGGGAIAALVTVVGYFVWHLDRVHARHEAALKAIGEQHAARIREMLVEEREMHMRSVNAIDRSNRVVAAFVQKIGASSDSDIRGDEPPPRHRSPGE